MLLKLPFWEPFLPYVITNHPLITYHPSCFQKSLSTKPWQWSPLFRAYFERVPEGFTASVDLTWMVPLLFDETSRCVKAPWAEWGNGQLQIFWCHISIYLTCLYVKAAMTSQNEYVIAFESAFACHQDIYTDQDSKVTRGLTIPSNDEWDESEHASKNLNSCHCFLDALFAHNPLWREYGLVNAQLLWKPAAGKHRKPPLILIYSFPMF